MDMPDIHYARNGDVAVANQVIGEGPLDVVLVPDWVSNLVWHWYSPLLAWVLRADGVVLPADRLRQARNRTLRRPRFFPDLETRMEDMRTVLEAVGSERAAMIAAQEGCWMAGLSPPRIRRPRTASCSSSLARRSRPPARRGDR